MKRTTLKSLLLVALTLFSHSAISDGVLQDVKAGAREAKRDVKAGASKSAPEIKQGARATGDAIKAAGKSIGKEGKNVFNALKGVFKEE